MKMTKFILVIYPGQKFEDYMDLLLINDENKSNFVYIKDLTHLCLVRQNVKVKNIFVDIVYIDLIVKEY